PGRIPAGRKDPGQRGEGGEAVHEGVVDLQHDRLAAPCEAVDQRHPPQGVAPVEALLRQSGTQRIELAVAAGLGQDGMADVPCHLEGGVLHEERVAEPEEGASGTNDNIRYPPPLRRSTDVQSRSGSKVKTSSGRAGSTIQADSPISPSS